MTAQEFSSTDRSSPPRETLDMHVAELKQLLHTIDAAPFRERDLDPGAEEFIVEWARELRPAVPLRLIVHLGRETATPDPAAVAQDAVRDFFRDRALATRRSSGSLLRRGRISLVIGLAFVAAAVGIGDFIGSLFAAQGLARIVQESLAIGSWVALWGPLGIFLYDW